MPLVLVTRHPATLAWARARGLRFRHVRHLDPAALAPDDRVMGNLPLRLAAEICARGHPVIALDIAVPTALRGRELDRATLAGLAPAPVAYRVERLGEIPLAMLVQLGENA